MEDRERVRLELFDLLTLVEHEKIHPIAAVRNILRLMIQLEIKGEIFQFFQAFESCSDHLTLDVDRSKLDHIALEILNSREYGLLDADDGAGRRAIKNYSHRLRELMQQEESESQLVARRSVLTQAASAAGIRELPAKLAELPQQDKDNLRDALAIIIGYSGYTDDEMNLTGRVADDLIDELA